MNHDQVILSAATHPPRGKMVYPKEERIWYWNINKTNETLSAMLKDVANNSSANAS